MTTLRHAWTIARRDLAAYCRDRTAVLLGFLLPIALVTAFGYSMKVAFGSGGAMPKVALWVVDEDGSPASRELVAELRAVEMLHVRPAADGVPLAAAELRDKIAGGDAHHGLIVASGFGAAIERGAEPELTLIRDPGREMEDRIVRIGAAQAYMAVTEGRAWPDMIGRLMRRAGLDEARAKPIIAAAQGVQRLIERTVDEGVEAPEADADGFGFTAMFDDMLPLTAEDVVPPDRPKTLTYQIAQAVSGVTVMMLMFALMACSTTLLLERDRGTLQRLLVAPIPSEAVIWGKFLFCGVIGIVQLLVLFTFAELVFRIGAFRDPLALIVLSASWAAAATSFGMLVAAWARSAKQAEGLSTLLILVMAAVGGCWFPIQIAELPLAAEIATRCTITYWAMTGYQGLFWHQLAVTEPVMLGAIGVQWAFAVLASALAVRLYRLRYANG